MSFQHIRGHERILKILTRIIETRRLAHAYLFSGPEGIGKRLTALAFSKIILCSSESKGSCGNCPDCIQVDQSNHPDLILVEPQEGKITVDNIRNIKRELSRKSFAGGYKLCIINNAEKMNENSQNALLKTLEEPSPATTIILITSQPYLLLPTIISRCQHLKFQPLSLSSATEVVMKKGGFEPQIASFLVALSGGSPGKALKLNIDSFKELRKAWINYLGLLSKVQNEDILKFAEEFSHDKEISDLKLNFLRLWYRDIILYKIYGNTDHLLNKDKTSEIASQSSFWSLKDLLEILVLIEEYQQNLERNANFQLTMETLFMKLNQKSLSKENIL
ncbi:MAG: DNA polymerase III subunit delta' [Deltaproteobacteria bacterium]|nr:MAG: DNA polymerase III subunit delta' [Deltaproteobacteria bacterium]